MECGSIAHLVEHLFCIQKVVGSKPAGSTNIYNIMAIRDSNEKNYKENMRDFLWQEHFFKYDKNKNIFILGAVVDNQPYFNEIEVHELGNIINSGNIYPFLNEWFEELAKEVIENNKSQISQNNNKTVWK